MYVLRRRAASAYSRQAPRPFVWSRYNRHVCPSSCFWQSVAGGIRRPCFAVPCARYCKQLWIMSGGFGGKLGLWCGALRWGLKVGGVSGDSRGYSALFKVLRAQRPGGLLPSAH